MRFGEGVAHYLKHLKYAEIWLSDIIGQVDFTMYFRPHGYPLWFEFGTGTVCATVDIDNGIMPQARMKVRLEPVTDTACDTILKKDQRWASEFQFCIEWTGHCKVQKVFFFTDREEDPITLACELSATCTELTADTDGIQLDDYSYEI